MNDKEYDVVIAGAGIIGASLAFELARSGSSVLLLDAQEPGHESSWAAAGTLSPAPDPESTAIAPLACESYRLYPQFISALESASGESAGFYPEGALEIFFGSAAESEAEARRAEIQSVGLHAQIISIEAARRREPALGSEVKATLWIEDEAWIDPRVLTRVCIRAAEKTGAEVRDHTAARKILSEGGKCRGLEIPAENSGGGHRGKTIRAEAVIIAAGWRSREIRGAEGFAPSSPVRGQMISLGKTPGAPRTILRSDSGYMAPREDGRTVIGSTLEPGLTEKHPTAAGLKKILSAALEMAPALAEAPLLETWAGLRPDSPDHLPIIGETATRGLFIATGHYRNGMLLAPATAKFLAEWIRGGKISSLLAPFSPLRFAASKAASFTQK